MRYLLILLSLTLFVSCKSGKTVLVEPEKPVYAVRDSINDARFRAGTSWYATGNEPGWSLQIDRNRTILFRDQAGNERKSSLSEKIVLDDGQGFRYVLQTETGLLEVRFMETNCTDDMSGESFPFEVTVNLDYTQYKGCGGPTFDHRLQGKWDIVNVNEQKINPDGTGRQATLHLQPETGQVSGTDGCNHLKGPLTVALGHLKFGPLATTKMACHDSPDQLIQSVLNASDLTYSFKEDLLELRGIDGQVLLLRKAE